MHRVLELIPGEVLDVHLPAPDAAADTSGFAGTPHGSRSPDTLLVTLPHVRIMVVLNPHPAPPVDGSAADDTDGFLMKAESGKQPIPGGGGSGAPISLLFEWMANPAGTFVKGYGSAWFD